MLLNEADQSEFNAGIATLMRINEIKKWLDICTIKGDPIEHFKHLKAFWKEIDSQLPEKPKDKKQETVSIQHEQQEKYNIMNNHYKNYINKKLKKILFIDYLDYWEIELRRLEQTYGLNMPKKSDGRWAMAR